MRRHKKTLILAAIVTVGLLWFFFLMEQLTLPNVAVLKNTNPEITAFMRRYDGEKPLKHTWIPYTKISPYLKEAVILAEDGRFFEHKGVDWKALGDAFKKNWEKKRLKWGASTITQQLAKNLYLSPSKNPLRKFREMLIAIKMEQSLSKQRILEIYLNVVEWGTGIYGAEAAAKYYYHTTASRLGPTQAAWLATILPNPRRFQKNRNGPFIQRRVWLLLKMMGL